MIRPLRDEVERYGHYSLAAESMYDHPFQWGSKRTGPDLARVGGKYSDDWHRAHLNDPRVGGAGIDHAGLPVPGRDASSTISDIAERPEGACALSGVPYTDEMIAKAHGRPGSAGRPPTRRTPTALVKRYPKAQARNFDGNPEPHHRSSTR